MRHPRAREVRAHPRLGRGGAVRVDVLQDLAQPAGAAGLEPLPREVAFGLQLQFGQAFLVPEPQVLGPFEWWVGAAFRLPGLVDGLVGVPGHVEPVDDPPCMGQMLADALPETRAHVAGGRTHIFGHPVVVHEIPCEPFDRGRILAGGTSVTSCSAGSATAVMWLRPLRLVSSMPMASAPVWSSGFLAPCTGQVTRGSPAWMNALYWKKSGWRHTRSRLSCAGQAPPAARPGATEARAGLEADHDVQLLAAVVGVTEVHGPHLPR